MFSNGEKQTSGAKIFSSHAGAPTGELLLDTDPRLYEIQKAVEANSTIIEQAEAHGVRNYILVPCIVYSKGEGFGNCISIQTTAIVKAAKAVRAVYKIDEGRPTWPVCHVLDTTSLYIQILRRILLPLSTSDGGGGPPHGKEGYYLASPGSVAWDDIYGALETALARRHVVDLDSDAGPDGGEGVVHIRTADDAALARMGEAADDEVELILQRI